MGTIIRIASQRKECPAAQEGVPGKVAIPHRKFAEQRRDFQHKLSTEIVHKYDAVRVEDLSLKGLARTKLARSIADAACGEFHRQLEYKVRWCRKHSVEADHFFPSSRLCNVCGAVNDKLTLKDREWDCACGIPHKRDFLAACNRRDEGLRKLAAGQSERFNARGDSVRPGTPGCCR